MKPAAPPTAPIDQTLEQIRMRYALAVVQHSMQTLSEQERGEYVARCKNLPAQVLQNGLNQALAFCAAKAREAKGASYAHVLQQVDGWLSGRGAHYAALALAQPLAVLSVCPEGQSLLEILQNHSMDDYILATEEALHLLHHMKRFASAFALE